MQTIVVESVLNDPAAIFLTTVLVAFVDAGSADLSCGLAQSCLLKIGTGAAAGLLGGSGYLAMYPCGLTPLHRMDGERRIELSVTDDGLAWLAFRLDLKAETLLHE
jgi:NhaP-type Na+/H+ and K+/H+ antiporter